MIPGSTLFPLLERFTMHAPTAVLFALMVLPAFMADDAPAKALTPAEAAKKVNEKVTVEMEVKSSGGQTNHFLNSEADFKDAKNFTVFIPKEAIEKFAKAKIDNPATHFKGKTIRVTGTVTLFQEKPQIKVEDPDQIKIVEKK
jgi:DNA/RNA endonuclease YhcR with UshA esterase domain